MITWRATNGYYIINQASSDSRNFRTDFGIGTSSAVVRADSDSAQRGFGIFIRCATDK
ncbi:hypothetical protein IJI76_01025 [Candidatus Saccharibacteria bacterium]|nr:hypothetical protein [Candidatus Saccharibacteria bacterium]